MKLTAKCKPSVWVAYHQLDTWMLTNLVKRGTV